ncbi:hypothetical protein C2845_PM18G12380 [Panicum miliaceum]|uniref:DUF3615 domain-containing protein n=1 Tax=Panicum miliaceum TaxID=4540 RepID=A0A3L6PJ99_PANMI|nr:hypothetical protein C2845_PM18G12380 [Panicum miliaceum]
MPTSSAVTQDQAGADVAPPQPGEAGRSEPSPHIHDVGRVEPPSSPSPPPAPARAPERKDPHDLRPNPKVQLAQAKRFATGVLEHYNKNKKIKFELLDAKPVISIPEPRCCYTHINFTARSSEEDSHEQLFFAEILHCGKRRAPSGFIVTCCEPLDSDSAEGQKFRQPDGSAVVSNNADFTYCFACTERMLHPRGESYVAGHCNIPCVYDYVR